MATFLRGRFAEQGDEKKSTLSIDWLMRQSSRRQQAKIVAGAMLETGRAKPGTPPGDERTLRGIPVIGAMGGAIAGTQPEHVPDRLGRIAERFGDA